MIKIFEKFDLKNLSPNEIKILRAFLYFEIDILQLPLFDKTIQNLESKMIIKKVPKTYNSTIYGELCNYKITEYARLEIIPLIPLLSENSNKQSLLLP